MAGLRIGVRVSSFSTDERFPECREVEAATSALVAKLRSRGLAGDLELAAMIEGLYDNTVPQRLALIAAALSSLEGRML